MAQLKDLLVNGVSRLVGDVFLDKLNAPTTSAGNDFGLGTNGQVLKTNGDHIYWGADAVNAGTVTSVQVAATSPVVSSVGTAQSSTLSTTISLANNYGDMQNPYANKTKNYVLAAPNGSNGAPSFRALVAADLPTVTVAKGGTGMTTATNKNAVVIGNSTTVTNAMQTVRTASGAFYATGQDAKPQFGTLPVAQGGTGVSTAAANTVLAGPVSGNDAAPEFRELQNSDMENISLSSQQNLIIFIQTTTDKTSKNQSFKIDSGNFNSVAYNLGGIKDKQSIVNLKFTYGLDTTLMNFNSGQSYLQFSFYDGDGTTLLNINGIRIASNSTGTIPLANSADDSPTHIILSPGQIIKGYLSNDTIFLPYANSIFSSSLSKNGIMFNLGNNKSPNFPIVSENIGVRNNGSTLFFNNSCCTAMAVVSDQELEIGSTVVFSTSSVGYVQKTTTTSKRDAMIIVDPLICSCIYNPFNLDPNQSNIYYVAIKGIVPIQNASSTANIGNYFVNNNNGKTTNSSSFNNFTLGQIIANSGTRKLGSVTYQLTTSFVLAKLL